MISFLSILAVGFFLGMRHATDPDHVIAVTTDASAGTESECLLRTAGRNGSPGVSRFLDSIE
jgi:hypothetical protein